MYEKNHKSYNYFQYQLSIETKMLFLKHCLLSILFNVIISRWSMGTNEDFEERNMLLFVNDCLEKICTNESETFISNLHNEDQIHTDQAFEVVCNYNRINFTKIHKYFIEYQLSKSINKLFFCYIVKFIKRIFMNFRKRCCC